ncbi:MAG: peptidoglycan bridge formation glycyltransferase FemA/FemB family protein [Bacilli bacterium]|nr:peptidoglycan bridge formation glycyltransferase FemA/FemB family protein [Bacilli bacterium]
MHLKELTSEEFNAFTKSYPTYSLYQTSEYANVMSRQYYQTIYVGLKDNNGKILAASLILVQKLDGFKYAYAPRGFLLDYNDFNLLKTFTKALKKFLGKREIIAVKLSPIVIKKIVNKQNHLLYSNSNFDSIFNSFKNLDYYHFGYNNFFEADKPRFEAIINLENKSKITLFKNINKSFRTKIRNAEKEGIKIYRGNETNLNYLFEQNKNKYPRSLKFIEEFYYQFERTNMVDFYYAKIDTKTFLEVIQSRYQIQEDETYQINNAVINPQSTNTNKLINQKIIADNLLEKLKKQLINATNYLKESPEGMVIATAMVIKHQKEVYVLLDSYDERFKHFSAKHLLLWKLIEKYSQLGYTKFNLGGITNPDIKNPDYDGLKEFKMHLGADVIEYIGDLELVTNNTLYFMYRQKQSLTKIIKK